jgi:beta-lactamase superfamily II metal-dependent hydrolase
MPFAAYSAPFIRSAPGGGSKVQQLLWGDFVQLLGGRQGDWVEARGRNENGWLHVADIQDNRLLEINFVDVGQGDGCFMVTPRDEFLLIDAGERDNLYRFLRWRLNLAAHPERRIRFDHTFITHADGDHFRGFRPFFESPQFQFGTIYHSGIVQRAAEPSLGPRVREGSNSYLTDVIADRAALEALLANPLNVGRSWYPNLLRVALESGRVHDIRMLSAADGTVPGFDGNDFRIEVLAPVTERDAQGRPRLRWFGDEGKTKNGHSIVLLVRFRNVRILLGGDLNTRAEAYLLSHYGGADPTRVTGAALEDVVTRANAVFGADVAKACHHGSSDFTDAFLRAVSPLATIVSSGDDEPHAHPRPDALGALGRYGRGDRPLIFSTELARSTREVIRSPDALRARVQELIQLHAAAPDAASRAAIAEKINAALAVLDRSVAVYGMITVRTDGRNVLLAQKLERPRTATREEFDVHLLEPGADGLLRRVEN